VALRVKTNDSRCALQADTTGDPLGWVVHYREGDRRLRKPGAGRVRAFLVRTPSQFDTWKTPSKPVGPEIRRGCLCNPEL